MTEAALAVPALAAEVVPEPRFDAQNAAVVAQVLRGVAAIFALGAEEQMNPTEIARRAAYVVLTDREEEGRAVVLIAAPSEAVVERTVAAFRRPVSVRLKEVAPTPALGTGTAAALPAGTPAPPKDDAAEPDSDHEPPEPATEGTKR